MFCHDEILALEAFVVFGAGFGLLHQLSIFAVFA
jgi:hypothetical protein